MDHSIEWWEGYAAACQAVLDEIRENGKQTIAGWVDSELQHAQVHLAYRPAASPIIAWAPGMTLEAGKTYEVKVEACGYFHDPKMKTPCLGCGWTAA